MTLFNDPGSAAFARTTGALYLTIAVAGAFSIGYVPSALQLGEAPDQLLQTIVSQRGLFNLGIAGDTIVILAEVVVTAMLFFMFRGVNAAASLAAALARAGMVAVMGTMLMVHAGLVHLAESPTLFSSDPAIRADLGALLLHIHDAGVWVWQILFTLHLLLLGGLVARSGRFHKWLGYGLQIGSFGYILDSLYAFAAPDFTLLGQVRIGFLVIVTLAEVGFAIWMVARAPAARAPQPHTSIRGEVA